MSRIVRFGIIGAGAIGAKRATALQLIRGARLVAVADPRKERARACARLCGADTLSSWEELVRRADIDAVIIAVPNNLILPVAFTALRLGKHVLCEKPLGRTAREAARICAAARQAKRLVKVGFNHRFHGAFLEAYRQYRRGTIGEAFTIRARYGHGGRWGMEKEWRSDPRQAGGGELLDQGIHLVDLARWLCGDYTHVYGLTRTVFWKTPLEDDAFVIARNRSCVASFHVSTTNWKNTFSFEIIGDKGFLAIGGLGRSYGEERLVIGRRLPRFGVPRMTEKKFPHDESWRYELEHFIRAIHGQPSLIADGDDGLAAHHVVAAAYRSARLDRPVAVSVLSNDYGAKPRRVTREDFR